MIEKQNSEKWQLHSQIKQGEKIFLMHNFGNINLKINITHDKLTKYFHRCEILTKC